MEKLTYEDWRAKAAVNVSDDDIAELQSIHNLDMRAEIESVLRKEYDLYVSNPYRSGDESPVSSEERDKWK